MCIYIYMCVCVLYVCMGIHVERESEVMLFVECDERWDCVCDV